MATSDEHFETGSRPVPDPTELTSRAVDALRKELTDIFNVQLAAQENITTERFKSLDQQLVVERELRKEQKTDRKVELDAALSAAKDLSAQQAANFAADTAKTEDRFNKALISQGETFGTAIAGQTREINDIKERQTRFESAKLGGHDERVERRESNTALIAVITIGVAIVVALILLAGFVMTRTTGAPS